MNLAQYSLGRKKYTLSSEMSQISARIIKAESKYQDLATRITNQICTFNDPSSTSFLTMQTGGKYLQWGTIEDIIKTHSSKKEIWIVTTSRGVFELQILNKPTLTLIKKIEKKKSSVVNLSSYNILKDFIKTFNLENFIKRTSFKNVSNH